MSESAVKQNRRDLRRAVGTEALGVIGGLAQNLESLRVSTVNLANRADANDRDIHTLYDRIETLKRLDDLRPKPQTLRARLRWLWSGR